MSWTRAKDYAALYPLPGALHWLVARRGERGAVEILAGGVEKTPSLDPLASAASANGIFARHPARWNILTPIDARAALVALPRMSEAELAQGIGWELQRRFKLADLDPIYDYEPLGETAAPAASAQRSSLLVAVRRSSVTPWQQWAATAHPHAERMEPVFSAAFRNLCRLSHRHAANSGASAGGSIYLLQDAGSSALAVLNGGLPILVRPLIRGKATDAPGPLGGSAGRRRVRETLLSVEDRHPRLEFTTLGAIGAFPPGEVERIASDCQLSLLPSPAPPRGAPAALVEQGTIHALCGGVLGFHDLR